MFAGMQGPPAGTLTDLGGIDTSTYLSPMDLYDQIFWGKQENGQRMSLLFLLCSLQTDSLFFRKP